MPKVRSPNRDKAFEIYKSKKGNIPLVEIAKQIGETDGTVRGWKSKDKWDEKMNGTFQTKNTERSEKSKSKIKNSKKISSSLNTPKSDVPIMDTNVNSETNSNTQMQIKRGAPIGNKNATGNVGGVGAPIGNKFALTTGEYESVLYGDIFDETELQILSIDIGTIEQISLEIREAKYRKRKMHQRIKELSKLTNAEGQVMPIQNGLVLSSVTKASEETTTVTKSALDKIIELEEAITRTQALIVRQTALLHKLKLDAERMEIEKQRLEIYRNKMAGIVDLDTIWGDEID